MIECAFGPTVAAEFDWFSLSDAYGTGVRPDEH